MSQDRVQFRRRVSEDEEPELGRAAATCDCVEDSRVDVADVASGGQTFESLDEVDEQLGGLLPGTSKLVAGELGRLLGRKMFSDDGNGVVDGVASVCASLVSAFSSFTTEQQQVVESLGIG